METINTVEQTTHWQKVLEKVVPAVVSLKFCTVRSFDTERPGFNLATGFIVDKTKGLILTNRHVARPGPVVAEAIFLDHEEVPVHPVYRDPIHDFGFYRFNPKDVKFMDLEEITLSPQDAKVGIEIRVVGNDAGEKLSILSGTFARLDRAAPAYGDDEYNDFNTFYYQAASNTSGGSSGSPVINANGKAVALNAGGKKMAASSFYLPLDRVARALSYLQQDILDIPRGDLQTIFKHSPYDQVHRLGLRSETESFVRKELPTETGMLVIDQVIPSGPSHNILEPGDIVVFINKKLVTSFVELEAILDDNVNKDIVVEIERGGIPKEVTIKVGDLHSITPNTFLEFGGGVVHAFSYQQAKNHRLPVGSVYVVSEGYLLGRAGLHRGCIIKSVGQTESPNLESFEKAISELPNKSFIPIRYQSVADRYNEKVAILRLDREWHIMQRWVRNDVSGKWDAFPSPAPPKPDFYPKPVSASPLTLPSELATNICKSLVTVRFNIPYVIDGGYTDSYVGLGLIIDVEKGLIVVDKNTVPLSLGDLRINFGASAEIPGSVLYLHPIHNFAVIKYDPSLLVSSKFANAPLSYELLTAGEDVYLIGMTHTQQPFAQSTTVSKVEELFINESNPPRYRAYNEEVVHLDKAISCIGAVIVNQKGMIQAIWSSYSSSEKKNPSTPTEYFRGMPVYLLQNTIHPLIQNKDPVLLSLETEFWPLNLSDARNMGLSDSWISKVEEKGARHLLIIRRVVAKSPASKVLKTSDLLLSINGKVVTCFKEAEDLIQLEGAKPLEITVLRMQQEITFQVETVSLSGTGTEKIVLWAGGHFQNTHRAVDQLGFSPEGVYCSRWHYGSPSHKYGLRATYWVVEVNGTPTPDLESFIQVIKNIEEDVFVRLKLVGLQDKAIVITLKLDLTYFPTAIIERVNKTWVYSKIQINNKP